MRTLDPIRADLAAQLATLQERIAAAGPAEVTLVCIPRHGYATTRIHVESLHANTTGRYRTLHVDVNAPPTTRTYLEQVAKERDDFFHLRIDEFCSRQTARLLALELVDTPFVVFLDNNMEVSPGWLDALLQTAHETDAALVSPILVTRGGEIHFSAGFVEERAEGIVRPHFQKGGKTRTPIAAAKLERVDIDFAESHCCLASTEAVRLPGVLTESLHNAQTLCCAGVRLKREHGRRLVIEPKAVAAIVPIAFGYDLPWLLLSYMDRSRIEGSYRELVALLGSGPSNDLDRALVWHQHHLKYLLGTMTYDQRLTRADLLDSRELPQTLRGYDHPRAEGTEKRIVELVLPYAERAYPELVPELAGWLDEPA